MLELSTAGGLPPGRISLDCEGGQRVLRLAGEIDAGVITAYADQQASAPARRTEPDDALITSVDLAEVTFLSSAALSFLIRQTQPSRRAGRLPVLRGLPRPARRVMEITGVTALFQSAA